MTFENSEMLISAIVLCICNNLSVIWHSFLEVFSTPVCDHACVMCAQLQRRPQHVPLSPVLLLDLFPHNRAWCFWQVYLNYLCKAKTGEPGIKAAWWRGKREWLRTYPDIPYIQSCKCRLAKVSLMAGMQWWNYSPGAGLAGNAQ